MTLRTYAKPICRIPVSDITVDDVLRCLKPIWNEKQETASRTRGRIEKVLDSAKARGLRSGENPARWKGNLDHLLPKINRLSRGHHAAMPYSDVPAFVEKLRSLEGKGARALELTILTAGRTGEVINATWPEIDCESRVWTIPAERMKMNREHRVPLCDAAIELLEALSGHKATEYIFFGQQPRKPISNMTMAKALKTLGAGEYTVHGFRSAFRDWVSEETNFPSEIAEQALAHSVGNEVERAYRRGDVLEKRRGMMEAWANYLSQKQSEKVVRLKDHGK